MNWKVWITRNREELLQKNNSSLTLHLLIESAST